jgi:hypothetical protein
MIHISGLELLSSEKAAAVRKTMKKKKKNYKNKKLAKLKT